MCHLLAVPHPRDLGVAHLPLQLEDAVHEGLAGGRAAGDVDVDGDDAVAAADDGVAVVVVAAAVGAGAHADDPAGVGHLVVDLAQGGRHLVGQRAGDDHHVRLARRRAEDDAQAVLVVARRGQVHHLDGAARQPEGHGPQRRLPRPVGHYVERGPGERGRSVSEPIPSRFLVLLSRPSPLQPTYRTRCETDAGVRIHTVHIG